MEKYELRNEEIEGSDGTKRMYKVLMKWTSTNIEDKSGRVHYGVYEPKRIFIDPEDIDIVIDVLQRG